MAEARKSNLVEWTTEHPERYEWGNPNFKTLLRPRPEFIYITHGYSEDSRIANEWESAIDDFMPHTGVLLEIGTGIGKTTLELHNYRPQMRLIACDFNINVINYSKNKLRGILDETDFSQISFICLDGHDLPLPDRSIDCIVWMNGFVTTVRNTPDKLLPIAMESVKRVLKPGGVLFLSGPVCDLFQSAVLRLENNLEEYSIFLPTIRNRYEDLSFIGKEIPTDDFLDIHNHFQRLLKVFKPNTLWPTIVYKEEDNDLST